MAGISVLISVYKSEKAEYLERALTSVWEDQTLKPEKIVLIQDGPVGSELACIVNQWEKKLGEKLEVIRNEQNIGLTKSLIKGISVIKTDYIARMDSDDISLPERFTRQAEFLEVLTSSSFLIQLANWVLGNIQGILTMPSRQYIRPIR